MWRDCCVKICPTCSRRLDSGARFCPYDGIELPSHEGMGALVGGRYRLLGELGVGAMGTVYRGWQRDAGHPVAIKVLHPELAGNHELRARFRREGRAVARLSHPNIVALHDTGVSEDLGPYLVMEYVDGVPLDESSACGGPMAVRRVLGIAKQVASALEHAHQAGIVHRDLKLGNVMLEQRDLEGDQVKVVDFGIAKTLDHSDLGETVGGLTWAGAVYGTPEFMSPEQASGGPVDHRADLYSLGVVMYRLLTGELPFRQSGMLAVLAHLEEPVPDPRDVLPQLSAAAATLVMQLMAKDPATRPQRAQEVCDRIGRILAARPERPMFPSVIDEASSATGQFRQRPARSHSMAAMGTLSACLVLGAMAVASASGVLESRSSAPETSAVTSARSSGPIEHHAKPEPPSRPRRAIMAAASSSSIRVLIPEELVAGDSQTLTVDVWNANGEPWRREIRATFVAPNGKEHVLVPAPGPVPGHYQLTHGFEVHGRYSLAIEVGTDASFTVYLEVADHDARS